MREDRAHQFCLFFGADVDIYLEHLFAGDLVQVPHGRRIEPDHARHIGHLGVDQVDVYLFRGHKGAREKRPCVQPPVHRFEVFMRDRIAEDHLALRVDAPGSVERNVAVEAQLSQVVDLVEGASGRDKYLGAAAVERLDGTCGRRGNSVCLKTDERAVDVEKDRFYILGLHNYSSNQPVNMQKSG